MSRVVFSAHWLWKTRKTFPWAVRRPTSVHCVPKALCRPMTSSKSQEEAKQYSSFPSSSPSAPSTFTTASSSSVLKLAGIAGLLAAAWALKEMADGSLSQEYYRLIDEAKKAEQQAANSTNASQAVVPLRQSLQAYHHAYQILTKSIGLVGLYHLQLLPDAPADNTSTSSPSASSLNAKFVLDGTLQALTLDLARVASLLASLGVAVPPPSTSASSSPSSSIPPKSLSESVLLRSIEYVRLLQGLSSRHSLQLHEALGRARESSEDYEGACDAYLKAIVLLNQNIVDLEKQGIYCPDSEETQILLTLSNRLGESFRALGKYPDAFFITQGALFAITPSLKGHSRLARYSPIHLARYSPIAIPDFARIRTLAPASDSDSPRVSPSLLKAASEKAMQREGQRIDLISSLSGDLLSMALTDEAEEAAMCAVRLANDPQYKPSDKKGHRYRQAAVLHNLGSVYLAQSRYNLALESLQKALKVLPKHAEEAQVILAALKETESHIAQHQD